MQIKKPMLVLGTIALLGGGAVAGISSQQLLAPAGVSAQETNNGDTAPHGPAALIDKLVERFGLNRDDVQQVFDEEHAARQADMEAKFEDRLSQAVTDGKLTEEQKAALIQKHEEMQAEMENLKDLSPEERQAQMKQHHEEMKTWLEEQGIQGFGFFTNRGMGPHMGH